MKRAGAFFTAGIVICCFGVPALAGSDAGSLDGSFGSGGEVVTDLGGSETIAALSVGSRIVSAGATDDGVGAFDSDVALARYRSDGSLDRDFGEDGHVITDLGGTHDAALDIVPAQSPSYLVLAAGSRIGGDGLTYLQSFLLGYSFTGELEPGFGEEGRVELPAQLFARAMALQSDGKLLIAGDQQQRIMFMLIRLLRSGEPDSTFGGGDGRVMTDFGLQSHAVDVLVQPDGKILVVGWSFRRSTTRSTLTMARYRPNGHLDRTFGDGGRVLLNTRERFAVDAALQSTSDIVVALSRSLGSIGCGISATDLLLRFDSHGDLDTSFGRNGGSLIRSVVSAVTLEPDDDILAVGFGCPRNRLTFALSRYTADGASDAAFGHEGTVSTRIGTQSIGTSVAVVPGGGILVGGGTLDRHLQWSDFALARYVT
jgi:uncharacterized delta-60 repeat protein